MAIDNIEIVDAVGLDKENGALRLMISNHLEWNSKDLSEAEHLLMLQDKVNSYISYVETKQYKKIYPNNNFKFIIIEIHSRYNITLNCEKFLNVVQSKIRELGIRIKVHIDEKLY